MRAIVFLFSFLAEPLLFSLSSTATTTASTASRFVGDNVRRVGRDVVFDACHAIKRKQPQHRVNRSALLRIFLLGVFRVDRREEPTWDEFDDCDRVKPILSLAFDFLAESLLRVDSTIGALRYGVRCGDMSGSIIMMKIAATQYKQANMEIINNKLSCGYHGAFQPHGEWRSFHSVCRTGICF